MKERFGKTSKSLKVLRKWIYWAILLQKLGKILNLTAIFAVLDMLKHLIGYLNYKAKSTLLEVYREVDLAY